MPYFFSVFAAQSDIQGIVVVVVVVSRKDLRGI